jgi:FkbH-like protein
MTIRVSSTSFLLPGNRQWTPLSQFDQLHFGEYGDWHLALLSPDSDSSLCVIFLEDIVPDTAQSSSDFDAILLPLLQPLEMRLSRVQAPTLIAFSGWRNGSPIHNARQLSWWRQLVRRFEDLLYQLAASHPSLYILNLDSVWAQKGMATAFDTRNFYAARCRLSSQGIEQLVISAVGIFERIRNAAKKVLVLDCDNTLWGGVVGEVGTSGITLESDGTGNAFVNFQKAVRQLSREGILLVLASKNNEAEVWDVFESHPGMALQRSDIVAARIDWNEKAENVRAMAEELDLGLSSFVFWDDNPLEREKMRSLCPEVTTPELPVDVGQWPDLIKASNLFARFSVTSDDERKSAQYRNRAAFVSEKKQVTDEAGFLRSIAMQPRLLPITAPLLPRAEQLCAKTNQYNLRTIRHTAADIAVFAGQDPELTFLVQLSDRFGDHGIIAMAIVREVSGIAFLDTFLMSCRVLGRHLEAWILEQIVSTLQVRGVQWLLAEFIPSGRNEVSRDFLSDHGFVRLNTENDLRADKLTVAVDSLALKGDVYFSEINSLLIPYKDVFNQL